VKQILISEIFGPTLQGEGPLIGRPTVFVRTGGCDFRCTWCDTLYAVLPEFKAEWKSMAPAAIIEEVLRLSKGHPILVTVSGGNPALQPLGELIELGRGHGLSFALETQGSASRPWFAALEYLILSPKPPSSGMATDWDEVRACVSAAGPAVHCALKIVVFDEDDYQYARAAVRELPVLPCYLQVGTPIITGAETCKEASSRLTARTEWLLERVTRDGWNNVTVLPQLHVMLWGSKRGV